MFPEEKESLNITKEEIQNTMMDHVKKARDYLCKLNPDIVKDKMDVKFSVIIEKPSAAIVFFFFALHQAYPPRDFPSLC